MFGRLVEMFKEKNMSEEEEIQFKNFEEEAEKVAEAPAPSPDPISPAPSSIEGANIELKVVRPADFSEVSTIADYLIEGCTVVLNVELLDRASTMRMLDFLNGVTYTKDGEIKNVSLNTYIITPSGIDVHD